MVPDRDPGRHTPEPLIGTAKSLKGQNQNRKRVVGPRPRRGGARDRASPREVTPWVRRMLRVRFARGVASSVAREEREQVIFPVFTDKTHYENEIPKIALKSP